MNTQNQKVSMAEKIGYSLGDCSANLVFQMMMIYQLKFYTDVFGLSGAIAGTVLLIARIVDAFVDPTVGILSDKTQTKWGKFRPWVVWTAAPFMVFYVLAFYNPGIEDKGLVALYAGVSYILLMSLYSFNNTPYSSLGGVMSSDIKERTSITSVRFVLATVAQFVVQGLTLPLVSKFGAGNEAHGWLCTISIFAVVGFVFLLIAGFSAKERIAPPATQKMDVKNDLKELFRTKSWRSMFILTLFVFITLAMWGSAMCYYFQNYVDSLALADFLASLGLVQPEGVQLGFGMNILDSFGLISYRPAEGADMTLFYAQVYNVGLSVFNMVGAVVQLIGVITLSQVLANRFGKRDTFIVCLSLTALLTAAFILPSSTSIGFIFLLGILKSLAYAPTVPLLWAMIADVADHMEYTSHRRATGLCFSGVVFALKAGLGVGGAIAGMILSIFGYMNISTAVQSEDAIFGIRLASSVVPAICFALGVAALFFYPITKSFNEKMQSELAARRASDNN